MIGELLGALISYLSALNCHKKLLVVFVFFCITVENEVIFALDSEGLYVEIIDIVIIMTSGAIIIVVVDLESWHCLILLRGFGIIQRLLSSVFLLLLLLLLHLVLFTNFHCTVHL